MYGCDNMKHYFKSDGNGGINLSIGIALLICTIIAMVSSAIVYGVTTRKSLDTLETDVTEIESKMGLNEVKDNDLRISFERILVKIDGMTEDVKEIKSDIKEIKEDLN